MDAPQLVVTAGGRASRLGALAATTPKSILPIGSRPFLALLLDWAVGHGVGRIHLCLGHLSSEVLRFVRSWRGEAVLSYAIEPVPLGVAGALRWSLKHLDEVFVLVYGDVLPRIAPTAPLALLLASDAAAVLSVVANRSGGELSNVALTGARVKAYDATGATEGLSHLDIGVTALRREVVEALELGRFVSEKELYRSLGRDGKLAAYRARHRSLEIGSVAGYVQLNELYATRKNGDSVGASQDLDRGRRNRPS